LKNLVGEPAGLSKIWELETQFKRVKDARKRQKREKGEKKNHRNPWKADLNTFKKGRGAFLQDWKVTKGMRGG